MFTFAALLEAHTVKSASGHVSLHLRFAPSKATSAPLASLLAVADELQ
jgi:hypothetical protein